jgi:N-methylhydantoinase A
VLASFGGSGSLAVCRLLELLGLPAAVVPRDPGNLSAFGLLTVDVKNDEVQTAVARHADLDPAPVAAALADLEARAAAALDAEGFPRSAHRYLRSADLRYFGQAFEVRVPIPGGPVDRALLEATAAAFHDAHRQRYGYSFRDDPAQQVEWVNLRVTGVGPIRRPTLRPLPDRGAAHPQPRVAGAPEREGSPRQDRLAEAVHSPTPAEAVHSPIQAEAVQSPIQAEAVHSPTPAGTRPACFDPEQGFVDTAIYRRDDLYPGDRVEGPAVVEEYGATVPLHPGFAARVDPLGNLVVTRAGRGVPA